METRTYIREPAPAHAPPDPTIARRSVPIAGEDSWLTRTDVAHLFQVSPSTVTRWAREGRIPAKRTPGGHYRYPAPDMRRLAGTAAPGDVVRLD